MSTYKPMAPCPDCDRHIRISETSCPFCGGQLRDPLPAAPDTNRRMTRAAAFIFGATVAVTACGETVETDDGGNTTQSSSSGGGTGQALYGAPAVGGGGGSAGSAGIGGNQAMYGAPAVGGGGGGGAGGSSGDGGFSADYGAPPLPPAD